MSQAMTDQVPRARVIVVGNEKGGSGKSTVAMHLAIGLLKSARRVATLDLDSRQKTLTHYIENRHAWAQQANLGLEIPDHRYFVETMDHPTAEDEAADGRALIEQVDTLALDHDFIVIDCPGRDSAVGRLAHANADILVTPMNDSFIDLDVLGTVDRETLSVTGTSHYAQMVAQARRERQLRDGVVPQWIVLRNRLSMLASRNTRLVDKALQDLARELDFRCVDGLAERVIFREFYARGLTALDMAEASLGTRPTLSHVTARREIEVLVAALTCSAAPAEDSTIASRDAA